MPQATQAGWLRTLGRLPWWRQSAYAKASGNGDPRLPVPAKAALSLEGTDVHIPAALKARKKKGRPVPLSAMRYEWDESLHPREAAGTEEGGQFAPSGGEGAESAQATKSRLRDWQMTGHPVTVSGYYVGGLGRQLGLKGRVAARFDLDVAGLWKAHDAAKDIEKIGDRYKAISTAVGLAKGLVDTYPNTLSFVAADVNALHRAVALRSQRASRESELGAVHWLLRRLSGGDLSRASERYAEQGPHIWAAMADLHPSRTEWAAILRSILADHPDWTREHVLREARRRRGVLGAEARRRTHEAPKATGDGDKTARAKAGVPPNTSADDGPDLAPLLQHASYAAVELNREPTRYEKKVDFAAIDRELTALAKQGRERVRAVLVGARDRLLALVGRKHKDGALTTKFVNDLELRGTGQLVPTLREVLREAFRHGERQAAAELHRGRLGLAAPKALTRERAARVLRQLRERHRDWPTDVLVAETRAAVGNGDGKAYQVKLVPEGLPPVKALEFFEQKAALWGADIRDPLLSDAKNALYNAIKTGEPLRDTLAALEAVFLPWLGDEDQQVDDQTVSPYRLETLVRTTVTEAMTEGRKAQFQDEVDSGFIIGYQYSAILDTRTCFIAGTLVQLANGSVLPIEQVSSGDEVTTGSGRHCRVVGIKWALTERLVTVELVSGERVVCTPTHPFWIVGAGWIEAEHLQPGDACGTRNVPALSTAVQADCRFPGSDDAENLQIVPVRITEGIYFTEACGRSDLSEKAKPCQHSSLSGHVKYTKETVSCPDDSCRCSGASGRVFLELQETKPKAVSTGLGSLIFCQTDGREVWGDKDRNLSVAEAVQNCTSRSEGVLEATSCATSELEDDTSFVRAARDGEAAQGTSDRMVDSGNVLCRRSGMARSAGNRRVRRTVLASFNGHQGSPSRSDAREDRMAGSSYSDYEVAAAASPQAQSNTIASDCGIFPIATGTAVVGRVTASRETALVYDLEVEGDHSYLVSNAHLIAHNTEVCRYLDGKILPPDSPETDALSPPRHWNCRSLLSPVLRTEGPVEYITAAEVARGRALSGAGFADQRPVRRYEGLSDRPAESGIALPELPSVVVHQAPTAVHVEGVQVHVPAAEPHILVEGPQVHVPAPVIRQEGAQIAVRVEAPVVHVPEQAPAPVQVQFSLPDDFVGRLAEAMAQRPVIVNVSPRIEPQIVVNVPPQEAPVVTVNVPEQTVSQDGGRRVRKTVVRDQYGRIAEVVEVPIDAEKG